MGLEVKQLREYIIQPALEEINLFSKVAEKLILGTIAHESNMGKYIHQLNGPALGICQMEPATHHDLWINVLNKNRQLLPLELSGFGEQCPDPRRLIYDLKYAVQMCRFQYWRFEEPLPHSDNLYDIAAYWKKYWNTNDGKGSISDFILHYKTYVCEI